MSSRTLIWSSGKQKLSNALTYNASYRPIVDNYVPIYRCNINRFLSSSAPVRSSPTAKKAQRRWRTVNDVMLRVLDDDDNDVLQDTEYDEVIIEEEGVNVSFKEPLNYQFEKAVSFGKRGKRTAKDYDQGQYDLTFPENFQILTEKVKKKAEIEERRMKKREDTRKKKTARGSRRRLAAECERSDGSWTFG